jgi:hypothetical protein
MLALLLGFGANAQSPSSGLFLWRGWPAEVTDAATQHEESEVVDLPCDADALLHEDEVIVQHSSSNTSSSALIPLTILIGSNTTFLEADSESVSKGIELNDDGLSVLPEASSCGSETGLLNQIFLLLLRAFLHFELQPFRVYLKVETLFGTLAHVLLSTDGPRL